MAAVVRVKRCLEDVAAPSLLLSCKRTRVSDEVAAKESAQCDVKSIFKFAGTVYGKNDKVITSVRQAIRKEKLENEFKVHNTGNTIANKCRRWQTNHQRLLRYRVVAEKRSVHLDSLDDAGVCMDDEQVSSSIPDEQRFRLFDVVPQEKDPSTLTKLVAVNVETISCNGIALERTKVDECASAIDQKNECATAIDQEDETQYVYDIYYMNKQPFEFSALQNITGVEAYDDSDHFMYRDHIDYEKCYDDEDDSNDEDNWRNDYPDEDPLFYENQDYQYCYGDDDTDFDQMEDMLANGLKINRYYRQDTDAESDEDNENHTDDHLASLQSTSHTDYDTYKARVKMQLNTQEDS